MCEKRIDSILYRPIWLYKWAIMVRTFTPTFRYPFTLVVFPWKIEYNFKNPSLTERDFKIEGNKLALSDHESGLNIQNKIISYQNSVSFLIK